MKDVDSKVWQQAINLEMETMYFNQVWELVNLPEGNQLDANGSIREREVQME